MSKQELCRRLDLFAEGNWEVLWRDVVRVAGAPVHTHTRDAERSGLAHRRSFGARNRLHIEGVAVETSRDGSESHPSRSVGVEGVRGIATGCSLRRLVARTLAKQFAEEFERECAPFR